MDTFAAAIRAPGSAFTTNCADTRSNTGVLANAAAAKMIASS
jgi:hypothetical protein